MTNPPPSPRDTARLSFLVPAALAFGAVAIVAPFWPALLLGAWVGILLRPASERLARALGGRPRVAGVLVLVMLTLVLVPIGILVGAMAADGFTFVQSVLATKQARAVLEALVSSGADGHKSSAGGLFDLLTSQAENAWALLKLVAGAASKAALDVVVFFVVTFAAMVDGRDVYRWTEEHLPMPPPALARFAAAFVETGRALLVGAGGGAAAQGVAATIAYLALGVPRAMTLGALTALAALVPVIGTVIVWGPIAAGLFATGRYGAGVALVIVGVVLIGGVDNFLRPLLTRGAHLQLPLAVVVVAMFGGLALLGPAGLLGGVLVVRLAKEALLLWREQGESRPANAELSPRTDA